ncbi:UNVERIFIED_CONTAM: hypothetical protein Sradi_2319900 [Sesamum radiatum]|uniref:Retroviral polymerase SH3-like domain-containing protein n=1 Tax=Sesamum radiatum TaxID=300843 RepID=A0AAW2T7Z0_SESRA
MNLRVFGCLCFVSKVPHDRNKFHNRNRKCLFVGHPYGKKGWRVYDIEIKKYLVSRDIVFHDDIFPNSQSYDIFLSPAPASHHPAVYDNEFGIDSSTDGLVRKSHPEIRYLTIRGSSRNLTSTESTSGSSDISSCLEFGEYQEPVNSTPNRQFDEVNGCANPLHVFETMFVILFIA